MSCGSSAVWCPSQSCRYEPHTAAAPYLIWYHAPLTARDRHVDPVRLVEWCSQVLLKSVGDKLDFGFLGSFLGMLFRNVGSVKFTAVSLSSRTNTNWWVARWLFFKLSHSFGPSTFPWCSLMNLFQISYRFSKLRKKEFEVAGRLKVNFGWYWQFSSYGAEFSLLDDLVTWYKQNIVYSLYFGTLTIMLCPFVCEQ